MGEPAAFADFFGKLIALDEQRRIYGAIRQRFSRPVRRLMENRYVFDPFWQHYNGIAAPRTGKSVAKPLRAPSRKPSRAATPQRVRLYILCNQLVRGGSTWNSGINLT